MSPCHAFTSPSCSLREKSSLPIFCKCGEPWSTVDSVQSDGPDLAQSDISDETLIKCLDKDHEFDSETTDQTDSVKTNTHKPVHVDNQAESYSNTSECTKATSKQDFIESNKTDQAKVSDHSLKTESKSPNK